MIRHEMKRQKDWLLKVIDKAILEAEELELLIGKDTTRCIIYGTFSLESAGIKSPKMITFKIPGTNVRYKIYNYEEILELFRKRIKKNWRVKK